MAINYQAFFFDFDGVVADSVAVKARAFAKLFEKYGSEVQARVVEHHIYNGGMTRTEKFKHYFQNFLNKKLDEQGLQKLCNDFSLLVVDEVVAAPEISGAGDFIRKWYKDVQCFIISATPDEEIKEIVSRRGLHKYFVKILGASHCKTDNLLYLIDKYGVNPKKCLFFGDSSSDYNAACAGNIPFIGIVQGSETPLLKAFSEINWVENFKTLDNAKLQYFCSHP